MKKSDIVLIGIVVLIILIAFLTTIGKGIQKVVLAGEPGSREIAYDEYTQLIESEEPFLVVIESTGCGYCEQYMPVIEKVASDKNIPITYIDIANLSEKEQSDLSSSNDYLSSNEWGTPTTLLLKGKKELASLSGYVNENSLIDFIDKYISLGEETADE